MTPTHNVHEMHHSVGVTIQIKRANGELIAHHTFADEEQGSPLTRARAWGDGFAASLRAMGAVVGWIQSEPAPGLLEEDLG